MIRHGGIPVSLWKIVDHIIPSGKEGEIPCFGGLCPNTIIRNRNRVEVKMFEFKNRMRIKGLSRGNIRIIGSMCKIQSINEHPW